MSIIFATTNLGKLHEIQTFLKNGSLSLRSLNDFQDRAIPEVEETGNTLLENALIKARAYHDFFKAPVIADDSGLIVPALDNAPGVFSSRYAGTKATTEENNALLLQNMHHLHKEDRKAYFECVMVYKDADTEKIFSGKCHGLITTTPEGKMGFGYDPLFYINSLGKTFAQIDTTEKNKISHRGIAVKKLGKFILSL